MIAYERTLLGHDERLVSRQKVYECGDGLEIERAEHLDKRRRWVLFEDVVLVTCHRERSLATIAVHGFVFLLFFLVAATIYNISRSIAAAIIVAAFGCPSLYLMLNRLVMKVDVLTVFGVRSRATIRFPYQRRRAREVYDRICARTREVQEKIASENEGLASSAAELNLP